MDGLPYAKLAAVSFSVATNEDRKTYAVAKIKRSQIDTTEPQDESLYDMRMGVNNDTLPCKTCMHHHKLCQKHFGVIPLAIPMINPIAPIFGELLRWLTFKCFFCGHNMINPEAAIPGWKGLSSGRRMREVAKALKVLRPSDVTLAKTNLDKVPACPNCSRPHPLLVVKTTDDSTQIRAFLPERAEATGGFRLDQAIYLTPVLVKEVIYRVTDADIRLMGHNPARYNPRSYVKDMIEVPPPNLRSNQLMNGSVKPRMDALTQPLIYIIAANNEIEANKMLFRERVADILDPNAPIEVMRAHEALRENARAKERGRLTSVNNVANTYNQYVMGKVTASSGGYVTHGAAESEGSIAQTFHGKHGLPRQDGLGTRNHNRSRLVIYNNPHLKNNQVLLPLFTLMRLRRRTIVTQYNYTEMRRFLLNGPNVYPGAFTVTRRDGTMFSVDKITHPETFDLRIGDAVDRMILEGETININRQPSTLLTNICAHEVVVDPNPNQFAMGLNNEVCGLYNADFDGDQMTVLALKDTGAVVESQILAAVTNHFMSDQKSVPNWGLSQDGRTMIAELSRSSVKLTRAEAMMICEHVTKAIVFDKESYTGRELISLVLPRINYRNKSTYADDPDAVKACNIAEDEREVVIKDGQVLSGVFDKRIVAPTKNSIFDVIYGVYGLEAAVDAIYNLQQIALAYSRIGIFTISPRDFVITDRLVYDEIHQIVDKALQEADCIVMSFQRGLMTAPADRTLEEHFEAKMVNELQMVEPKVPVYRALPNSSLLRMVLYGSRGNLKNLMAIVGCVGQPLIGGKRIPRKFDYKRANIYQQRCDLSPEACGFVPDPYCAGIKPSAYLVDAQSARDTIIRKALATSIAGQMCRLVVRNTESLVTNYAHLVMCHKRVVEWVFGDNNFDPGRVFEYEIPGVKSDSAAFEKMVAVPEGLSELAKSPLVVQLQAGMRHSRDVYRRNALAIQDMSGTPFLPTKQRFPLDILMQIGIMRDRYGGSKAPPKLILERLRDVEALCEWFPRSSFRDGAAVGSLVHLSHTYSFMQMYVRACLNWHSVGDLSDAAWRALLQLIRTRFLDALIQPNEAIGTKSATATSEPVTQNQLDSTHGVGKESSVVYTLTDTTNHIQAKNITKMGVAKMWMRVRPELEEDRAAVERVAASIQIVALGEFMEQLQIFYEQAGRIQHPEFAQEKSIYDDFLKLNLHRPPSQYSGDSLTRYCIRIQLDRRKLLSKAVSVVDIVQRLYEAHENIYIVHNTLNDTKNPLVLRIHLQHRCVKSFNAAGVNVLPKVTAYAQKLLRTSIRGVEGIVEAYAAPLKVQQIDAAGAIGTRTIYIIRTKGSNMIGLAGVKDILPESIETNSMHETCRVLGMHVSRAKILQEWCKILQDFVPSYFILLTDVMISASRITPLNLSGNQVREGNNALLNMGTGLAMKVVMGASLNEVTNPLYGLSGPLLTGQTVKQGTGLVEVAYDPRFIREHSKGRDTLLEAL